MITNGNHLAMAVTARLAETSKGGEQLAVLLRVVSPESGDPDPSAGQEITMYMHFSEKTIERTIAELDKLGWTGTDLNESFGEGAPPTSETLPKTVHINVYEEADLEGEMKQRVRMGGGLAVKTLLDAAKSVDFSSRMKGNILAIRQGKGAVGAATAGATAGANAGAAAAKKKMKL